MRLIDADALMEHVYRDRLDSRELIADMVKNAPTIMDEISSDGTLTVTVPKGANVGRVLVQEDGTQYGGLFYPDEDRKRGKWIFIRGEEAGNALYECSECGKGDIHAPEVRVSYCWHCGAQMGEEA